MLIALPATATVGKVDVRQSGVLRLFRDQCRSHVGGTDDLLLLEAVGDRRSAAEAHDDRDYAEGDENCACSKAAQLEELPSKVAPLRVALVTRLSAVMVLMSCLQSFGGSGVGSTQADPVCRAIRSLTL